MDISTGVPKLMSLHLLEEITDGFSKHRKLGGGAYGDVYLGEHKDGVKIAVKVLKDVLNLEDEQFEKEYRNLAILEHKNVVRLVGSCNETKGEYVPHDGRMVFAEKARRMLCFEYMCNGNLETFIYDESNACNWHTRYGVIKGICEGLEYLHEKLKPDAMYHLDLKPANVLLDENMSPKIADFGVSRLFLEEKTRKTNSGLGTLGYIPPEYIHEGLISNKFDIFSLGVLIIKIMTGREGYFRSAEMSPQQFVDLVHMDWMNRLQAPHAYSIQARRCIEIAISCVETDRRKRPSIGAIVSNLNQTEYGIQMFDALRNRSDHQLCPCICSENEMLDILKSKSISYALHVADNKGRVHEATITTAGNTSTFQQPVKPRIKIIDCKDGSNFISTMDMHSTEPWRKRGEKTPPLVVEQCWPMKKPRLNGYRKKRSDLVNAPVPDEPVSELLLLPQPDLTIELPDEPVLEVMMNSEPVLEVVLNSEAQEVVPDVPVPDVQKMRGPSGCGKKFRSMNKLCYGTACRSGRKKQKK